MNVVSAAFFSYVLALAKNSYEKCARKTLMKLTACHLNPGPPITPHGFLHVFGDITDVKNKVDFCLGEKQKGLSSK